MTESLPATVLKPVSTWTRQTYSSSHFFLLFQTSTKARVVFFVPKINWKIEIDSNKRRKKLPPPFCWQRYGNLQMLPSPTQNPRIVRKNWVGLSHCCRSYKQSNYWIQSYTRYFVFKMTNLVQNFLMVLFSIQIVMI